MLLLAFTYKQKHSTEKLYTHTHAHTHTHTHTHTRTHTGTLPQPQPRTVSHFNRIRSVCTEHNYEELGSSPPGVSSISFPLHLSHTHTLTHTLTHFLTHSLTLSHTHSPTHPLSHSLDHSYSLIPPYPST